MALQIFEHNTFLDVLLPEELELRQPRGRSWSEGPRVHKASRPPPLPESSSKVRSSKVRCEVSNESSVTALPGDCSPCVFFASSRGCDSDACGFCHKHAAASLEKRPRKQTRDRTKQVVRAVMENIQDPRSRLRLQRLAGQCPYTRSIILGHLDAL
ncbi:unnamed protein product [Effrenium voratum]|uniref:Uncharacterized protein n=1 Tax=Effrenium voratum TaxID=2562239 RepID=A0AA36IUI4_9DINO|nr:unnamed protein product [Effrenium voratum]